MEEFDIEKQTKSPDEYSEEEKQLQREFGVLKQLKKTLLELKTKIQKEKQKEEEKVKAPQLTSKAKEQATKLLKSGAIKINSKNKNTFKRKIKETDQGANISDDEDVRSNTPNVANPAPAPPSNKKPRPIKEHFVSPKQNSKPARENADDFELNISENRQESAENVDSSHAPEESGASNRKRKQQLVYLNENKSGPRKKTAAAPFQSDDEDDDDVELPSNITDRNISSANMQDVLTPQAGGAADSRMATTGGKTLCVMSYQLDEDILTKLFSKFGKIEHMNIVKTEGYKHQRAKAFVTLDSMKSAEEAILALDRQYEMSRCWTVTYAKKQKLGHNYRPDRSCETWSARASHRENSPNKRTNSEGDSVQETDPKTKDIMPSYDEISRDLVSYEDY